MRGPTSTESAPSPPRCSSSADSAAHAPHTARVRGHLHCTSTLQPSPRTATGAKRSSRASARFRCTGFVLRSRRRISAWTGQWLRDPTREDAAGAAGAVEVVCSLALAVVEAST